MALQGVQLQMQQMQQQHGQVMQLLGGMQQQQVAMQQQLAGMQHQQVALLHRTSTALHMARKFNAASGHRLEFLLQPVPNADTGALPPAHLVPDTPMGEIRAVVHLPFLFPFDCPSVAATSAPRLFFACHAAARAMTVAALRRVLEFYDLSTEGSKEVMTQRFFDFIGV